MTSTNKTKPKKMKLGLIRRRLRLAQQVEMELEVEDAEVAWALLGPMGYEIKVARISERHYWLVGCLDGRHRAAALSKIVTAKYVHIVGGSIEGKCYCPKRGKLSIVAIIFSLKTGAVKVQSVCRNCDMRHLIEKGKWPESEERWRH